MSWLPHSPLVVHIKKGKGNWKERWLGLWQPLIPLMTLTNWWRVTVSVMKDIIEKSEENQMLLHGSFPLGFFWVSQNLSWWVFFSVICSNNASTWRLNLESKFWAKAEKTLISRKLLWCSAPVFVEDWNLKYFNENILHISKLASFPSPCQALQFAWVFILYHWTANMQIGLARLDINDHIQKIITYWTILASNWWLWNRWSINKINDKIYIQYKMAKLDTADFPCIILVIAKFFSGLLWLEMLEVLNCAGKKIPRTLNWVLFNSFSSLYFGLYIENIRK